MNVNPGFNNVLYKHMKDSVCLFTKRHILDSAKLKEFADGNSYFHVKGGKFSEWVENTVGKGEIARYEIFLLFS